MLPHRLRSSAGEDRLARERTQLIWRDKYLNEPYEPADSPPRTIQTSRGLLSLLQQDAGQDHANFLYQYRLPHYKDAHFLNSALERYKRFLFLWRQNGCSLHTPYDIQLLWRVHSVHPELYYNDLERLSGGKLIVPDLMDMTWHRLASDELWTTAYEDEPLLVGGTGFRGRSVDTIDRFPSELLADSKVDSCTIGINDIVVSDIWSGQKQYVLDVKRMGDNSFAYTPMFTVDGKTDKMLSSADVEHGLGSILFQSMYHKGLEFHIYGRKGRFCFKKEQHIAAVFYNPRDAVVDGSFLTRTVTVTVPKVSVTDPSLQFTANIKVGLVSKIICIGFFFTQLGSGWSKADRY